MKMKGQNGRGLYLQNRNTRWKWMAGATAATTAGVTAAQGSMITINLLNNYISATGGNHLSADLTGGGHPDVTISGAFYRFVRLGGSPGYTYSTRQFFTASANLNGVHARAYFTGGYQGFGFGSAQLGSQRRQGYADSGSLPILMGSLPIAFTDTHINGGALTNGSLEVTVSAATIVVQLDSFSYDTRAVPDQGSSLTLLAMGAGGVLALRRWRVTKSSKPQLSARAT